MTAAVLGWVALSGGLTAFMLGAMWEGCRRGGSMDQARAARRLRAHLSILQAEARATDPMWADFLRTQR